MSVALFVLFPGPPTHLLQIWFPSVSNFKIKKSAPWFEVKRLSPKPGSKSTVPINVPVVTRSPF